jgi:hypothetical protein
VEKVLFALFIIGHVDILQWRLLTYSISTVVSYDATAELRGLAAQSLPLALRSNR